jgi:hypothetical protein
VSEAIDCRVEGACRVPDRVLGLRVRAERARNAGDVRAFVRLMHEAHEILDGRRLAIAA